MSTKPHIFELRQRENSTGVMTGANTELTMDGQKIMGVRKVKVEVEAGELAKITIEVVGRFHVIGQYGAEQIVQKEVTLVPEQAAD